MAQPVPLNPSLNESKIIDYEADEITNIGQKQFEHGTFFQLLITLRGHNLEEVQFVRSPDLGLGFQKI
jgi:hypothetical protein